MINPEQDECGDCGRVINIEETVYRGPKGRPRCSRCETDHQDQREAAPASVRA